MKPYYIPNLASGSRSGIGTWGGFPWTLVWLRSLPGFKAAAREMADA